MKKFFIIYFATVSLVVANRGEAAVQFDFMEKPAAFDSKEVERLIEEINFEKLEESARDFSKKVQEKNPELADDLEVLKDKSSEGARQSQEWLEEEAGIDVKGIFGAILRVFRDVFLWMVSAIKNVLN